MCSFSRLAKCQLPLSCLSHEVSVFLEPEVAHDEEASLGVCYKLLGKNICTSMINLLPPSQGLLFIRQQASCAKECQIKAL